VAIFAVLYIGKGLFVPLIFSLLIAIVLSPIVGFLEEKGLKRVYGIILTLILLLLFIFLFVSFLVSQVSRFTESWPALSDKFSDMFNQAILWAADTLRMNPKNVENWVDRAEKNFLESNSALIGQTLTTFGSLLVAIIVVPVYIFLFLYYEKLLLEFLKRIFGRTDHENVGIIINQTKAVLQRYLGGLVIELAVVATMEILALTALGIDYAVLLGLVGALFNIVPYIGPITASILAMIVALATKDSIYALYVLLAYYVIQLIDNNLLLPRIVASRVRINALFSIFIVFAGGVFWGIAGMFLSIPLLAIVKLIFDNIDSLNAWGFLLGDTIPEHKVVFKAPPKKIRKTGGKT
jgi:predicted PurR-regulated permease PerM